MTVEKSRVPSTSTRIGSFLSYVVSLNSRSISK
jgi:hypothetical protein